MHRSSKRHARVERDREPRVLLRVQALDRGVDVCERRRRNSGRRSGETHRRRGYNTEDSHRAARRLARRLAHPRTRPGWIAVDSDGSISPPAMTQETPQNCHARCGARCACDGACWFDVSSPPSPRLIALVAVGCSSAGSDDATSSDEVNKTKAPARDFAAHPAIVEVDEADELYALSDPHGHYDELVEGARGESSHRCSASADPMKVKWTGGTATLLVLGDLDRQGREVARGHRHASHARAAGSAAPAVA